jgi:hypothetical protein
MYNFASRTTNVTATDVNSTGTIVSSDPIRVWGIVVVNSGVSSNKWVNIQDKDGTTFMVLHTKFVDSSVRVSIPFIADNGLKLVGQTTGWTHVRVYYSQTGT